MGCSPSKGKLFSKPDVGLQKTLLDEAPQEVDCRPAEVDDLCLKTEEKEDDLPPLTEKEHTVQTMWTQLDSDATVVQNAENIKEVEVNLTSEEKIGYVCQPDQMKKTDNQKKNKSKKRSTGKQRKSSNVQTKVDFPPHMVLAHQATYSFLNPNISKYKTLISLLDQAAQTQKSLQPMMKELVLQFENMNQALEEIADEGELMLLEHGEYMALPSGMLGQAIRPSKSTTNTTNHPDPPPDLIQQLLQHSLEKMKQVASSVQALGDTTLEEAVENFSSISLQLAKKMQVKQAAEYRLIHVLAQIEGLAIRKSNPEDTALHSEDSGIGGENESLTGSERRHRGSAGSCESGVNTQGSLNNYSNYLTNVVGQNEDEEDELEDEEQDGDDNENDRPERMRSSSSPPDPSQAFRYMHANCPQNQELTAKRPLTATKPEHSSSTSSTHLMTELLKTQLDHKIKNVPEIQGMTETARHSHNMYRVQLKRHSLNGSVGAYNSPIRTNQPPCSLPSLPKLANQPSNRHSIRRLINAFSQGVDGRPGQSLPNIPPHIRRPNKRGLAFNHKNNNNSWSDGRDNLDMDNLPPPPLEVLMDNSFQSNENQPQREEELQEDSVWRIPVINQKTGNNRRRKALMQNVDVLPNRANMRPRSVAITPTHPTEQEAVTGAQYEKLELETEITLETEKANSLYQQARKIIHLCNAAESPNQTKSIEHNYNQSTFQARTGQKLDDNKMYEPELSSCNLPVTAPPVSRVRLPPSCPSVRHRYPSPPVFRPQSTSRPTSRPNSPRAAMCAKNTKEEIVPSVSFQDARSFFCRNELQNSQAGFSFGSAARQQGEASRGRLLTRGLDPSVRRAQSENGTGGTSPSV